MNSSFERTEGIVTDDSGVKEHYRPVISITTTCVISRVVVDGY